MKSRNWIVMFIVVACLGFNVSGCQVSFSENPETPTSRPASPTTTSAPATTAVSTSSNTANRNLSVIYDDGSRDGTAALLYLLSQPEISLEAASISYGEAHPEIYIQHIGRIFDYLGFPDIPLGAGQDVPLAGGMPFPDWLRDLSDSFWNYPLPNADSTYPVQKSPELIVSLLDHSANPVTIFLSGTFTNLAQALRIDPAIKQNIAAVYFMGGAVHAPGNITNLLPDSNNQVAEWNMIADPQAAYEVFEAGLNMYMIPLDATNQVTHTLEEIQPWQEGNLIANLAADLYEIMLIDYGFERVEIFDLTAAVLMIRPDFCAFQPLNLQLVTEAGNTLGQTMLNSEKEPNIYVCLEPDVSQIKAHLNETFTSISGAAEIPAIDPLIGTWVGSASNNGHEMQVTIVIDDTCEVGQVCGGFEIPAFSCSGSFIWGGMEGNLFHFAAAEKTDGCGDGDDYLALQEDGTLMYLSKGDYGETLGFLEKQP